MVCLLCELLIFLAILISCPWYGESERHFSSYWIHYSRASTIGTNRILSVRGGALGFTRWFSSSSPKESSSQSESDRDNAADGSDPTVLKLVPSHSMAMDRTGDPRGVDSRGKRDFMLVAPKRRALPPSSNALVPKSLKPKSEEDSYFLSDDDVSSYLSTHQAALMNNPFGTGTGSAGNGANGQQQGGDTSANSGSWWNNFPKVNVRLDPAVNFKLKQRLKLLGAMVTFGMDYMSDIGQWRSYCSIEDSLVRGRFSLRGSELGWTKSWLLNFNLGNGVDDSHGDGVSAPTSSSNGVGGSAPRTLNTNTKLRLRLGLDLKTHKLYAKLRFRTEPMLSTIIDFGDVQDGLTCAGKLPLPASILPVLKSLPLRVEYRLRLNTLKPIVHSVLGAHTRRRNEANQKFHVSTGLGAVDVSLDELNFCLEWDEQSPLWGIGIVKTEPLRRAYSRFQRSQPFAYSFSPSGAK